MPDAPRWLDRDDVARYLRLKVDAIARMVRDGRIPEPSYALGERHPRWDREKLDATMGGGIASTNMDEAVEALVSGQEASRRPHRQAHAR